MTTGDANGYDYRNRTGYHRFHAPEDEDFILGGIMFGSTAGLLAFVDGFGPNRQNSYSAAAGVEGVSPTRTGVAGASLNMPGVYGQVEESPLVPAGLRAGVLGVASTQPGVVGFARDGDGVLARKPRWTAAFGDHRALAPDQAGGNPRAQRRVQFALRDPILHPGRE